MMRTVCLRLFLICTFLIGATAISVVNAQVLTDPGCDPCCPLNPTCGACPPRCIPIDGGLGLLLAAGVGVGVWRGTKKKTTIGQEKVHK